MQPAGNRKSSLSVQGTQSVAFLFDLDGTLVDSVYQHVLAWREAMHAAGIELAVWRIHRQIGMSGGLMLDSLVRGNGQTDSQEKAGRIQRGHPDADERQGGSPRPFAGRPELVG